MITGIMIHPNSMHTARRTRITAMALSMDLVLLLIAGWFSPKIRRMGDAVALSSKINITEFRYFSSKTLNGG
jgi:hypothetical protein